MPTPNIPKTTPECEQLLNMVMEGLYSTVFDAQKKEMARVALRRLRKNRCVKSLEYIIRITSEGNVFDSFRKEVCDTAMQYLTELT